MVVAIWKIESHFLDNRLRILLYHSINFGSYCHGIIDRDQAWFVKFCTFFEFHGTKALWHGAISFTKIVQLNTNEKQVNPKWYFPTFYTHGIPNNIIAHKCSYYTTSFIYCCWLSLKHVLWNTHFLVWVFVSECEKSLRAFAFLTRNRSLRSISLSLTEYRSKSALE